MKASVFFDWLGWIFLALVLAFSTQVSAMNLAVQWDENFQKTILLSCALSESSTCEKICGAADQCRVPESYCSGCAGTQNEKLRYFFENGAQISRRFPATRTLELIEKLLSSKDFVSISSDSIFNFSYPMNDPKLALRFRQMCPAVPSLLVRPGIVFWSVHPMTRQLIRPELVACEMISDGMLDKSRGILDSSDTPTETHFWKLSWLQQQLVPEASSLTAIPEDAVSFRKVD